MGLRPEVNMKEAAGKMFCYMTRGKKALFSTRGAVQL
jgi:hypothetical protein